MSTTPSTHHQHRQLSVDDLPSIFFDLTPIEQPNSTVCQIQYKHEFAVAYDYFRALLQQVPNEASDRALALTELCASLNPANYTVWQHRRVVYKKLLLQSSNQDKSVDPVETGAHKFEVEEEEGSTAAAAAAAAATATSSPTTTADDDPSVSSLVRSKVQYEFDLASRLGGSNPKTYQVWYHRRAIVEHLLSLLDPDGVATTTFNHNVVADLLHEIINSELQYVKGVVKVDGKNYHAWSYRQFLVMTVLASHAGNHDDGALLRLLSDELRYTAELITDDCRNNSAWNHRWFVTVHEIKMRPDKGEAEAMVWQREIEYALNVATLDPYNESPWRYMVAAVRQHVRTLKDSDPMQQHDGVKSLIQNVWDVMPGSEAVVNDAAAAADTEPTATAVSEGADAGSGELIALDPDTVSPHLLAAVLDLMELMLLDDGSNIHNNSSRATRTQASHLCRCLQVIDPIRQKYWRKRAQTFRSGA